MNSTAWQKRFRRLATVVGTVSSLYLLVSYTLDRLREARVTALKDRQIKDRYVYWSTQVLLKLLMLQIEVSFHNTLIDNLVHPICSPPDPRQPAGGSIPNRASFSGITGNVNGIFSS
jgi:hypothetical protein